MAFTYLTNVPLEKARTDYLEWIRARGFAAGEELVSVPEAASMRGTLHSKISPGLS